MQKAKRFSGVAVFMCVLAFAAHGALAQTEGFCPTLTDDLYQGMSPSVAEARASQVRSLQQFLVQDMSLYPAGADPENLVTGVFGPMTRNAVRSFQRKYGISAVGRVGPATRARIAEVCSGTYVAPVAQTLRIVTVRGLTNLQINGGQSDYMVDVRNLTSENISNITLKSSVKQGDTLRASREHLITCQTDPPTVSGTVPPGLCKAGSTIFANDAEDNAGSGSFAPGLGKVIIELIQNGITLEKRELNVYLVNPTSAGITSLHRLSSVQINGAHTNYSVYVQNPTRTNILNVILRSSVKQGDKSRPSREHLITCQTDPPTASGTVPPGLCKAESTVFANDSEENPGIGGALNPGPGKVLIELVQNGRVISSREANVNLTTPTSARTVTILAPGHGDETLRVGNIFLIKWSARNTPTVKISLLNDAGNLLTIAETVNASDSQFSWLVPSTIPTGNKYKIKIEPTVLDPSAADGGADTSRMFSIAELISGPRFLSTHASSQNLEINGGVIKYSVNVRNYSNNQQNGIYISSEVKQGETLRPARKHLITCTNLQTPLASGSIPPGNCEAVVLVFANDSEDNGGGGIFSPGRATVFIKLIQGETILDTKEDPVILVSPSTARSVRITKPNSGDEVYKIGNTEKIEWKARNTDRVRIKLLRKAATRNENVSVISESAPASPGEYNWVVPTVPISSNYIIRIEPFNLDSTSVNNGADESPTFRISEASTMPRITAVSPGVINLPINGSSLLLNITARNYSSTDIRNVSIKTTIKQGDNSRPSTSRLITCLTEPRTYTGILPPGNCLLSVMTYANDTENNPGIGGNFTPGRAVLLLELMQGETLLNSYEKSISLVMPEGARTVTIKKPTGDETYRIGNSYDIEWTSQNTETVKITLLRDNNNILEEILVIGTNIPATPGIFSWIIPSSLQVGGRYKIKIEPTIPDSTAINNGADISRAISIIQQPTGPRIINVAPSPIKVTLGASPAALQVRLSNPANTSINDVRLSGVVTQGSSSRNIEGGLINCSQAALGSLPSGGCTATLNLAVSNTDFPITNKMSPDSRASLALNVYQGIIALDSVNERVELLPSPNAVNIKINFPDGDESLRIGNRYTILWTASGATYINIDLLKNIGGNFSIIPIAQNVSAAAGSYSWLVPTALSEGSYKIKISPIAPDFDAPAMGSSQTRLFGIASAPQDPRIVRITPAVPSFTIGGSSNSFTLETRNYNNMPLGGVSLVAMIKQGLVETSQNLSILCVPGAEVTPSPAGMLPTGLCTSRHQAQVTGVFQPGSAILTVKLKVNGIEMDEETTSVALIASQLQVADGTFRVDSISQIPSPLVINGGMKIFYLSITNASNEILTGVSLQATITQGDKSRLARTPHLVTCGRVVSGTIPANTSCNIGSYVFANSTEDNSGTGGEFSPGPATLIIKLTRNGSVIVEKTYPIQLQGSIARSISRSATAAVLSDIARALANLREIINSMSR